MHYHENKQYFFNIEQGMLNTDRSGTSSSKIPCSLFNIPYSTIIFTTISFIKEAPEVPVSPTPTPFRL